MKTDNQELAQKIIVDSIIFERMHNGLQIMKAAFQPSGTWNENEPITQYNGTGLVIGLLLQEDNRDLEDEIYNIFDKHLAADAIKPFEERETAGVLSKRIIDEILLKLKYAEVNEKEVVS